MKSARQKGVGEGIYRLTLDVVAIEDLNPQSPVHLLVMPVNIDDTLYEVVCSDQKERLVQRFDGGCCHSWEKEHGSGGYRVVCEYRSAGWTDRRTRARSRARRAAHDLAPGIVVSEGRFDPKPRAMLLFAKAPKGPNFRASNLVILSRSNCRVILQRSVANEESKGEGAPKRGVVDKWKFASHRAKRSRARCAALRRPPKRPAFWPRRASTSITKSRAFAARRSLPRLASAALKPIVMGSLKDRIASDLKEAMRARDQLRLDTLRSALSGFTYKRTESGRDLSDADELDVVRRLVKQRGDSLAEFEKAGRADLADKERAEREILLAYLPPQRSAAEIREIVQSVLAEVAAGVAQRRRRHEGRHAGSSRA